MPPSRPLQPLLPRPPNLTQPPEPAPNKRRRVAAACTNCRVRKYKCDGSRPACGRCTSTRVQCLYEEPEGITRIEASKQKALNTEQANARLHSVLDLLRQGSDSDSALVLTRIREAESTEQAVDSIAVARTLVEVASKNGGLLKSPVISRAAVRSRSSFSRTRSLTAPEHHPDYIFEKQYAHIHDRYVEDDFFVDMAKLQLDFRPLTTASNDNKLMNHLITLFWTYDSIAENVIYRPLFEEDFHADGRSPDERPFCSPFLVNALLALSCLYAMEPATFPDSRDPMNRGALFAYEAEKHYEKEKSIPSITLMQGQYLLFCYEGNLGSGQKSMEYLLGSFETFRALNDRHLSILRVAHKSEARLQSEREGFSWIMWGLYLAEWRSSQAMGFRKLVPKPQIDKLWRSKNFLLANPDFVSYWWYPYPISFKTQKAMKVEIKDAEVALAEIMEDILNFLIPDAENTSRAPTNDPAYGVELYNRLVRWKYSLPPRICIEDAVLPRAILLHCGVEVIFTALLRPFSGLSREQFGPFDPRERCFTHATSLQATIWTFRAHGTLQYDYYLCHAISTAAFLAISEPETSPAQIDTLVKACQCLHEMSQTLPIAKDCLVAIKNSFNLLRLQIPNYVVRFFELVTQSGKQRIMHYANAPLIPGEDQIGKRQDIPLQELLERIENNGVD